MNYSLILIVAFLLLLVLFILNVLLILRIRKLEDKMMNVSYQDIRILTDELKDLVLESERVAEHIELGIVEKEHTLEDLSDLVETKLARLERGITANNSETEEQSVKSRIRELHKQGASSHDIAKELGISVAEVNLMIKLHQ